MPSASAKVPTAQEKDLKLPIDLTEPFKQVVTLVEHKIRNMEKRKIKLDGYKQEQEQGKDLNADQLAAVAKYGELMQSLEFARDLSKQVSQIQLETSRMLKKQNKREQIERLQADAERTKEIMIVTNWLSRLVMLPHVRADFVNGTNPSRLTLSPEENQALDELAPINLANFDLSLNWNAGNVNELFSNLLDGKDKVIPKTSLTYSHMKKLLLSLNSVSYSYDENPKFHVSKSDSGDADISADSSDNTAATVSDCAQLPNESGNFSYVQNMIESPDMDPAVVVTSTNAPPQLMNQQLATMHQVIPQTSQLGQVDHHENQVHEEVPPDVYNGGSCPLPPTEGDMGQSSMEMPMQGSDLVQHGQIDSAGGDMQEQPQEWEVKTGKYEGYGANTGEGMEGNDFMENNFSTWEGPQGGDSSGGSRGAGGSSGGNFRRGGGRYQNANSNGHHQGRGGGNRYQGQGGSGSRWAPQGDRDRGNYQDYRGESNRGRGGDRDRGVDGRDRGEGDYKPRGGGMRGGRGNPVDSRGGGERSYYNSGYRNGSAPRGGSSRRPYRGGGAGTGYGNTFEHAGGPGGAY